jgi:hypothetical protein
MGSEAVNQYTKRVRIAFIVVALLLPVQLYVVLAKGNMYPCVHLPGFQPVLDDEKNLYYTDRKLFAIDGNDERIPVVYTELFNVLPEFFARHTMNRIFDGADDTDNIALDAETKKWLQNRLQTITGKTDIKLLEVDTFGYQHDKDNPQTVGVKLQYTVYLNFDE